MQVVADAARAQAANFSVVDFEPSEAEDPTIVTH